MSAPLEKLLARVGLGAALDALADRLSGSELTTFLLELTRRRAGRVRPGELVGRYASDRFTRPAAVPYAALRRAEDAAIAAAPAFEPLVLSPLAPFALHSALDTVDQNKVVTTVRGNEVAADPTNALALEAAVRRRALLRDTPKSEAPVRLCAVQRVVRAQALPPGPGYFAHFHLAGYVSAGRDTGSLGFERAALADHLRTHVACARALGASKVALRLTAFEARFEPALAAAEDALRADGVDCVRDPHRASGRGYYRGLCFKSYVAVGDDAVEIGDGGIVDWTRALVGSDKERCFISGIGLDRLAGGQARA